MIHFVGIPEIIILNQGIPHYSSFSFQFFNTQLRVPFWLKFNAYSLQHFYSFFRGNQLFLLFDKMKNYIFVTTKKLYVQLSD